MNSPSPASSNQTLSPTNKKPSLTTGNKASNVVANTDDGRTVTQTLISNYLRQSTAADNIRLARKIFYADESTRLPRYEALRDELAGAGIIISKKDWEKGRLHLTTTIFLLAREQILSPYYKPKKHDGNFCNLIHNQGSTLRKILPTINLLKSASPEMLVYIGFGDPSQLPASISQLQPKMGIIPQTLLSFLKDLDNGEISKLARKMTDENKELYKRNRPEITSYALNEALISAGMERIVPEPGSGEILEVIDVLKRALLDTKKSADKNNMSTHDIRQLNTFSKFLCQKGVTFSPAREYMRSLIRAHSELIKAKNKTSQFPDIHPELKLHYIKTIAFEPLEASELRSFLKSTTKKKLERIASEMLNKCWSANTSFKKANKSKSFADIFEYRKYFLCIPYKPGNFYCLLKKLNTLQALEKTPSSNNNDELIQFCSFLNQEQKYFKPGNEYLKELLTNIEPNNELQNIEEQPSPLD